MSSRPLYLYNLRRSSDCLLLCLAVLVGGWVGGWVEVCVCVCACMRACARACVCIRYSLHSVSFGQPLRYAHKRIVYIIKVYIERSNMQGELIRFLKNIDFIHVYVCESMHSMQYRSPNPIVEGCSCQTVSIVIRLNTIGYNGVFTPLPGETLAIQ